MTGKLDMKVVGCELYFLLLTIRARALTSAEKACLVAEYNRKSVAAKRLVDDNVCRSYDDFEFFLTDERTITIPSGMHRATAITATHAGMHIFNKKSLGITQPKADASIEPWGRSKVLCFPVFRSRFIRSTDLVKDAMGKGPLAHLVLNSARSGGFERKTPIFALTCQKLGDWSVEVPL